MPGQRVTPSGVKLTMDCNTCTAALIGGPMACLVCEEHARIGQVAFEVAEVGEELGSERVTNGGDYE